MGAAEYWAHAHATGTVARAHMIDKVEQAGFPRDIAVKAAQLVPKDEESRGTIYYEDAVFAEARALAAKECARIKTLEPGYRDDIRRWVRCIRENRARRQQLESLT